MSGVFTFSGTDVVVKETTDGEGARGDGGATADGDGAAPMEVDGARQAAGASDAGDRPAGAAETSSAAPVQTAESDASYYTEDMPIAAYQPIVTNVLQPLDHAGEDAGDTEAAGDGARRRRGKQKSRGARKHAAKKAAREAALLTAGGNESDGD